MPNLAGHIAEGYPMCAADVNDDTDELRVIDGFAELKKGRKSKRFQLKFVVASAKVVRITTRNAGRNPGHEKVVRITVRNCMVLRKPFVLLHQNDMQK